MSIDSPFFTITIILFYVLGLLCSASAILKARTPQGAIAWIVGLLTMPFFAVPLFMIIGRSKFQGYTTKRKSFDSKLIERLAERQELLFDESDVAPELSQLIQAFKPICHPGFTTHNSVDLLIDGRRTYEAMFEALEQANKYIIFQFYVFRADSIGWKFAEVLMRKARQGVLVNFLYDEIGSEIPAEFIELMKGSGMNVCHFNSMGGKGRFQVNFRNHRKILIVDGSCAFVGGINIGDDYLGLWPELGPWRDTHLKLTGPSVMACQLAHAKDWFWCRERELEVDWRIHTNPNAEANVLILPSGPADQKQTCLLAHIAMVNAAQKRLWIANPYLVPPESLLDAILLAALRGVDVRIVIPSYSDAWIVMIASAIYIKRLLEHGVKVYRYRPGFLHEKVMLVDSLFAVIGSANLDFRSMFINFEITVVAKDDKLIEDVEAMLLVDFERSRLMTEEEFKHLSLSQRLTARFANLLAPVL